MAPHSLPNVGKKMPRALDLCIKPAKADFCTGEKPASVYFFPALELDGVAVRVGKKRMRLFSYD
jgi:hypothetical protein